MFTHSIKHGRVMRGEWWWWGWGQCQFRPVFPKGDIWAEKWAWRSESRVSPTARGSLGGRRVTENQGDCSSGRGRRVWSKASNLRRALNVTLRNTEFLFSFVLGVMRSHWRVAKLMSATIALTLAWRMSDGGMRARRGGQRGYLFRDPERRRHCRPWREQWRRKLCGQIPNTFWRHFSQDLLLINWTFGVRGKDEPGFEAEHPGWTVIQLTWYILRETPSLQTRLPQFSLLIIISRDPILTLPLLGSLPRFLMSFYNSVTVSAMLWNAGWLFKYETQLFF